MASQITIAKLSVLDGDRFFIVIQINSSTAFIHIALAEMGREKTQLGRRYEQAKGTESRDYK